MKYRVDGVWGQKAQVRLFPLHKDQAYPVRAFHAPWSPIGYRIRHSGLNLYHLKMITRERREMRRRLYNQLDPERRFQSIGYDYLVDEDSAAFEDIPRGREYDPPHKDDCGLWMPRLDGD